MRHKRVDSGSFSRRGLTLLLLSTAVSSVAVWRWVGLAIGPNRFGDVQRYNLEMVLLAIVFALSGGVSCWCLYSLLSHLIAPARPVIRAAELALAFVASVALPLLVFLPFSLLMARVYRMFGVNVSP